MVVIDQGVACELVLVDQQPRKRLIGSWLFLVEDLVDQLAVWLYNLETMKNKSWPLVLFLVLVAILWVLLLTQADLIKGLVRPEAIVVNGERLEKTEKIGLYKPVLDYEQAVIKAVDKASPSVVSISIAKDVPVIEKCALDPFSNLPPEFKLFFDNSPFRFEADCQRGTERREVGGGSGL